MIHSLFAASWAIAEGLAVLVIVLVVHDVVTDKLDPPEEKEEQL